jgi:hypothetical protein
MAADTSRTARGRGKVQSRFAEPKARNLIGKLDSGTESTHSQNEARAPYSEREKQVRAESASARQISGVAAGSLGKSSRKC